MNIHYPSARLLVNRMWLEVISLVIQPLRVGGYRNRIGVKVNLASYR